MLLLLFGFNVALLDFIALAKCFDAGSVVKMVQKGLAALQRLRVSGGPLFSYLTLTGVQERYEVPVHLARAAVVSPAGRSSDGVRPPRRSSSVDKPPLTAYGDPRHSARSRLQPHFLFGAVSARSPPSTVARWQWTPRALHGSKVNRVPQAAPLPLCSPPLPPRWFRGWGGWFSAPQRVKGLSGRRNTRLPPMAASRQADTPGAPLGRNRKAKTSGIWIFGFPVVQNAKRPREPGREDGENTEAGKRRGEREHEESGWTEQRTPGGNPDDGQGGPETRRLRE
ncbi:hypothetical protein NDU88_005537 [Pleurodeles waltl]|uniref:Uncharacterized protein n=1 Tax=Pleurodeles waltl TaxID=8319 RepID=A0AAV7TCA6_PLEWA|nr:hypothetical protein NDU88_005537 [Pleurodeles waltl]